eukprot:CAMPEP_0168435214 /NCGR_PEP_ID=MMETSP0228-20121227/40300_1 /TAXON_ID=133427 /ORGANISM="Protoceratium reticulatum, Strain CCCM 535 (=CCMP 1889)" /LENGTH=122 /DNA_ID=CAMNT_0008449383 /DNA_START=329 /DNA_END=698 /DNA_ORIENTATION=-
MTAAGRDAGCLMLGMPGGLLLQWTPTTALAAGAAAAQAPALAGSVLHRGCRRRCMMDLSGNMTLKLVRHCLCLPMDWLQRLRALAGGTSSRRQGHCWEPDLAHEGNAALYSSIALVSADYLD